MILTKERSVFRNNGAILFLVAVLLGCLMLFSGGADAATEGDWEYSVDGNEATITGYSGSGGAVVIPSTLGGYDVTSINRSAFSGSDKITSVSIPSSVTDLDNGVFKDCTKLETVDFLPGSTITLLPGEAFKGCTSLKNINIPDSVTHIGRYYSNYVFEGCTSLVTISIPDSVTHIGKDAFKDCTSLKSIVFTENSLLRTFEYSEGLSNVVPIVTDVPPWNHSISPSWWMVLSIPLISRVVLHSNPSQHILIARGSSPSTACCTTSHQRS